MKSCASIVASDVVKKLGVALAPWSYLPMSCGIKAGTSQLRYSQASYDHLLPQMLLAELHVRS